MTLTNGILNFIQKNEVKPAADSTKIQLIFFNDDGNSLLPEYFEESSTHFETFMSLGQICQDGVGIDPENRSSSCSLLDVFSGKILEAKSISKSWTKDKMALHISNFLKSIGMVSFSSFVVILSPGDRKDYSSLGRYLCEVANDNVVKSTLRNKFGINIPENTLFIHACFDKDKSRIHVTNRSVSPGQHVESLNYFEKKANWVMDKFLRYNSQGLDVDVISKKNAVYIVGRRSLTKGLYLSGDTYMQSYNLLSDQDGSHLLTILNSLKSLIDKKKSAAKGGLFLVEQSSEVFREVFNRIEGRPSLSRYRFAVIDPDTKEITYPVDASANQDEIRC